MMAITVVYFIAAFFGWIFPIAVGVRWKGHGISGWNRLVWLGSAWGTINLLMVLPLGAEFIFAVSVLAGIGSVVGWVFPLIVGISRKRRGLGGGFLICAGILWGILGAISFLSAVHFSSEMMSPEGFDEVYAGTIGIVWVSFVGLIVVIDRLVLWFFRVNG